MKNMKRLLAVMLSFVMIFGLAVTANAAEASNEQLINAVQEQVEAKKTVTFTNAAELARLVQLGYSYRQPDGPISITKGTLKTRSWWTTTTKTVYVVCLSGTDLAFNQSTGIGTDLLVGFEQDNCYIRNVRSAILEAVPKGVNLIIAGHSLGGMVAQQAAADSTIKRNYNVLNTVTYGSPLIDGLSREGTVKRLGDTRDVVPYLSVSTFFNIIWQAAGLNREDGGYSAAEIITAHCESYQRAAVWGAYDVTGTKNGNATLTLDFSTTRFFESPVIVTW
ncbi:MAG: hypothetical protein IKR59_01600 [Lachnospiraceae bacterium]|nr:hypothetical protein [Lachnospiraceae bacterium]